MNWAEELVEKVCERENIVVHEVRFDLNTSAEFGWWDTETTELTVIRLNRLFAKSPDAGMQWVTGRSVLIHELTHGVTMQGLTYEEWSTNQMRYWRGTHHAEFQWHLMRLEHDWSTMHDWYSYEMCYRGRVTEYMPFPTVNLRRCPRLHA